MPESNDHYIIEADATRTGYGDIVFNVGGTEYARIRNGGAGTGLLGGSMPVISVTSAPYNADPTGVSNCDSAFAAAVTAAAGGILYVPAGTYKKASITPIGGVAAVVGAGRDKAIISGPGFQISSNQRVSECFFQTNSTGVQVKGGTPVSNAEISGNRFNQAFVSIELPTNNQPQDGIRIIGNAFDNCASAAISVANMTRGLVAFNKFGTFGANTYNILFYAGDRNRIIGNHIKGGTTGIAFIYHKTNSGGAGAVWGNVVADNTLESVLEESISLDDRGNQADMAPMELDTVASHSTTTITLTSANWVGQGAPYVGYYAIFTTGTLRGCMFKITAQSDAALTLAIDPNAYGNITNGDEVVVGAPLFGNAITGNFIDATGGTDGVGASIMLWGLCYGNTVTGNSCYGKGIWVASHHGLTPNTAVTNVVRKAPSENNTVSANVVIGSPTHFANDSQINLHYINYGGGTDYTSVGNVVMGNQLVNAILTVTRHRAVVFQPQGSYADVYNNLSAGDNAAWVAK